MPDTHEQIQLTYTYSDGRTWTNPCRFRNDPFVSTGEWITGAIALMNSQGCGIVSVEVHPASEVN